MMKRFFEEPGPFFRDYGMTALYGIVAWCLIAPLVLAVLYFTTKPVIERLARMRRPQHNTSVS